MGLWGAAQALAFGLGGFVGTAAIDLTRALFDSPALAYAVVFGAEALLFLIAGLLATGVGPSEAKSGAKTGAKRLAPRAPGLAEGYAADLGGR